MGIRRRQLIETARLQPGDLLLLYDNSWTGHLAVALGQGVSKAMREGSRKLSTVRNLHAALEGDSRFEWTGNVEVASSPGDGR